MKIYFEKDSLATFIEYHDFLDIHGEVDFNSCQVDYHVFCKYLAIYNIENALCLVSRERELPDCYNCKTRERANEEYQVNEKFVTSSGGIYEKNTVFRVGEQEE